MKRVNARKFSYLSAGALTMIRNLNRHIFFIVIILDCCVEITRDIKPLKFDEILRSWILRKTEIFDFRNWLHLSATRRLIKFSEFRIEKCVFIRTREILSRVGFTRSWLAKWPQGFLFIPLQPLDKIYPTGQTSRRFPLVILWLNLNSYYRNIEKCK